MSVFGRIFAPNPTGELLSGHRSVPLAARNPFQFDGAGWDVASAGSDFARRFGIAKLGQATNDLAHALTSPADQLKAVNEQYAKISDTMGLQYQDYVRQLRELLLPDEEVVMRADAWIKPQLAIEMELLRLKFPYAVGNAGDGGFNPLQGLAQGVGDASGTAGYKQLGNVRELKKALRAAKKNRDLSVI